MKPLLLSLFILPLAFLSARAAVPGGVAEVTINLTSRFAVPDKFVPATATRPSFETAKFETRKFTNTEIIGGLFLMGLIPDDPANLKHWRLVLVDRSPLLAGDGPLLAFYATRVKTKSLPAIPPVCIPASVLSLEMTGFGGEAYLHRADAQDTPVSSIGHYTYLFKFTFNNSSDMDPGQTLLDGVANGCFDSTTVRIDKQPYLVRGLGSVTISPVIGSFQGVEGDDHRSLITGAVNFSRFEYRDISAFPSPTE